MIQANIPVNKVIFLALKPKLTPFKGTTPSFKRKKSLVLKKSGGVFI